MEIDLTTRNLTFGELNTQIVRMRKVIKKAKKELIRDLVRKSRKMKGSLNKVDTVATKRSKKAIRILEDINELKKLKCDDVAKFLLINELSFSEIAKQGGTEKERALARLSEQTHIKKEIDSYRNNFPRWSFQTQSLLNTWKFNTKMMKKKNKNKPKIDPTLNKQKNIKVKNEKVEEVKENEDGIIEVEENNAEATEEKDEKEINVIEMEGMDVLEKEENHYVGLNLIQDEAEIVKVEAKELKSDSINSLPKKSLNVLKASGEKLSLKKIIETFKHEEKVDKSMGEVVVKRFNLDNVDSEELKIPSKQKSHTISSSNTSISMPRSSFFLDMDNNQLGLGESDEEVDDSRVNRNYYEKGSKTLISKRKSLKPAGFKSNNRITSQNPRFSNNKNNFNQKETPSTPVVLHPSWAAKRNQKQHIFTEVKANKIKFDD